MTKISVVIAAKDEEAHIAACLESVQWADEIVVVNDCSTDRTVEIAESLNARVLHNDSKDAINTNKNLGADEATSEWIFSLDADEIIPPDLAEEIRTVIDKDGMLGYYVNRKNFFLGEWIKHCGWFPEQILRLYRKGSTEWPWEIHDTPAIEDESKIGHLDVPMIHNSYVTMGDFIRKFNRNLPRLGEELWLRGDRVSMPNFPVNFFVRPCYWFVRKYFFQLGFLDGIRGLFICTASAMTIFLSYAILWDLQRRNIRPEGS